MGKKANWTRKKGKRHVKKHVQVVDFVSVDKVDEASTITSAVVMAEKLGNFDIDNLMLENTFSVKEEMEDYKVFICETNVNMRELKDYASNGKTHDVLSTMYDIKTEFPLDTNINSVIKDNIKVEDEIISSFSDMKTEFYNKLLFCNECQEEYQDYCIKCGMLVHILNRNILSSADNRELEELPKDILEFRDALGQTGIFALKVIPAGVKIGPFTGLDTVECSLKIKGGRFSVGDNELQFLNWMWYINPARNISEQNLSTFQYEDKIYYRSIRQIQEGEELLVYFGEKYDDGLDEDVEFYFIPATEDDAKDVFACTFCCLGFNSSIYLANHKRNFCSNDSKGIYSIEEVTQCTFCEIHLEKKEYFEYHINNCRERNARPQHLELDSYKMADLGDLKTHNDVEHTEEEHIKSKQLEEFRYKCASCQYKTDNSSNFKYHVKTKHLKEFEYSCQLCEYRTNNSANLESHIKTRHLEEYEYNCEICEYRTNIKANLEIHINTKHLKEFKFKCEICDYKTNHNIAYKNHTQTIHLKEFKYKCKLCEYKINDRSYLEKHMKTKHLKKFDYNCEMCDYKTNKKSDLKRHFKGKHLKEFDFECESCTYKTNNKRKLQIHMNAKHFKEFNYGCDMCDYRTNDNSHLKVHMAIKHLKEAAYKCEKCDFKTNYKSSFEVHVKRKHLKQFNFKCESCEYKAYRKWEMDRHIKTIHLKEFKFKCELCNFKSNYKTHFETHRKRKHR